MNQRKNQNTSIFYKFSICGLICGILGLTSCCYPPLQLILGAAALICGYLSMNGKPPAGLSLAALITGGLSVVISLLVFVQYVWAIKLMEDPANASMMKEIYRQTGELMDIFLPTQPAQ